MTQNLSEFLRLACEQAGIASFPSKIIRSGENQIWRLPGGVVARISRPGQEAAAHKEVEVARWLRSQEVPAIRAIPLEDNPLVLHGRAISFWEEIPPHRKSRLPELALLLRRLHALQSPVFLQEIDPFVRVDERIDSASGLLADVDLKWLRTRLVDLQEQWQILSPSLSNTVLHGDAHNGNVIVSLGHPPLIIDLERFAIGPRVWDLTLTAVEFFTCGWVPQEDYVAFNEAYGQDVAKLSGFDLILKIRELRMTLFALQLAAESPRYRVQALERLACIRGERGRRPWPHWTPIP